MNKNPMIDQVNRLIANRLAAGGEYFLPGVGTLFVEKESARPVTQTMVEPPYSAVRFSSQQRGVSLVDEIARAAHCEPETAQSIYDRWLENVTVENGLVIEGVGELRSKHFTPDPEFDHMLNPQGHALVQVRRRKYDWAIWVAAFAVLAALVVGYFVYSEREAEFSTFESSLSDPETATNDAEADEETDPVQPVETVRPEPLSFAAQHGGVEPSGSAAAPASLVSKRRYVVYGVFAVPGNAARAAAMLERMVPSMRCGIYRFGDKLMVAPFVSDDLGACDRFKAEYRGLFPDLWTYTGR